MIVRAYAFRFDAAVTLAQAQAALDSLPTGDGIVPHRVRGIFEDGHQVQVELTIGDPVTLERIDLGRFRVGQALERVLSLTPRATGLEAGASDQAFEEELDKIRGPEGGAVGGFLADLRAFVSSSALLIALAAVAAIVVARRI